MSDENHYASPDDITKPIDVESFQNQLQKDRKAFVKDAKRALLSAAVSLSKAGDEVANASSKITEVLSALEKIAI